MKKFLGIIFFGLLFFGCERIDADIKEYCGTHYNVVNAKTNQAAKYAYEGCVAEEMELKK